MEPQPRRASALAFIVGCPRSGTTWVWGLVKAHPDAVPLMPADVGVDDPSPETGLFLRNTVHFIERVIARKAQAHPGKLIFEKTPYHVFKLYHIWTLFPAAKVVFVRRPAEATINSMIRNGEASRTGKGWSLEQAIGIWQKATAVWEDVKADPRVNTVWYRDLMTDPEGATERLFAFLGLAGHADEAVAANHRTAAWDAPGVLRRGELEAWKEEMDPAVVGVIRAICEPTRLSSVG